MFCPKCSQQQVPEEMRFCSRCGFPLSALRELVASGGTLVEREAESQISHPSPAMRGMRKGVWLMLAALPLTLVTAVLTAINDGFAVFLLFPVLCFVVGFARLLYGTFFEERASRIKRDALQPHVGPAVPGHPGTAARGPAMSTPEGTPIVDFTAQKLRTAEMAQPPSVTENTTRLLEDEISPDRR
jgi:hypothetical protein